MRLPRPPPSTPRPRWLDVRTTQQAIGAGILLAAMLLSLPASAAISGGYDATAALIWALASSTGLGWEELDSRRDVRWSASHQMLATSTPDGDTEGRSGFAALDGRTLGIVATGSLAGVGSFYIYDTGPVAAADVVAAGLRRAGLGLSAVRCARDPATADRMRGWYRVTVGVVQDYLYIGPLRSGGSQGYTLYLGDQPGDLPLMTQEQATHFIDCPEGRITPAVLAGPQTGQAGVAAVIEALLRPTGAPASLPWRAPLPAVRWNPTGGPYKTVRGDSFGGPDANPEVLSGDFTSPTTRMSVSATGDAGGANRFYLEDGANLPPGAVFELLQHDGYTLTAVTCGRPYLKMSENWFRIAGPGRQPAILYRARSVFLGRQTTYYAVWLDNVPPPLKPGQRAAAGGSCPG